MATIEKINDLLAQGDYLRAAKLADEHKIKDCGTICENSDEILEIANSIDDTLKNVSTLEEKLKKYEYKLRNVKEIAFQMKEKEGVNQVRNKNLTSVCDLIDELTKNLYISNDIHVILLNKPLIINDNQNDFDLDNHIEQIEVALKKLETVLQYKPDINLKQLNCVNTQKAHSENIKLNFGNRFLEEFKNLIYNLLSDYSENFISIDNNTNTSISGYDIIYSRLFPYTDVVDWIQRNDDYTYQLLLDLFNDLGDRLINIANIYNKQDGLYSVYLLIKLSQYVFSEQNANSSTPINHQQSKSFLVQIYSRVLTKVKGNFDKFLETKIQSIRESKPPKQSKCGVLNIVKSFELFARQVESIIRNTNSSRRSDIDECYVRLVDEVFRVIDSIEHVKTPTEMIRVENYKYLNDFLRSIKIPRLDEHQNQAKRECDNAVKEYAKRYSSKPLEKLMSFFEGVQQKIEQGVKEEEISFQLAFSRQELRKVLQLVNLKEVQKGLDEMYRRIEKHASEPDSSLMEVVWHAMQQEFVNQYEYIQDMIRRCYPATNLSLTFTIEDVLRVFSDIAQSH